LTTGQVAALCRTTEAAVVSAIQTGTLRGSWDGVQWRVLQSDAQRACQQLRPAPPLPNQTDGQLGVRRGAKRAGLGLVSLINFVASISAIITEIQTDRFHLLGYALAGLNALLGVIAFLWARRADAAAAAGSQAGEPARVAGSFWASAVGVAQIACVVATVAFIGAAVADDEARALTVDPSPAQGGRPVTVRGSGFPPNATGDLALPNGITIGIETDGNGAFEETFVAPGLPPGSHTIDITIDDVSETGDLRIIAIQTPTPAPSLVATVAPTVLPSAPPVDTPEVPPTFTLVPPETPIPTFTATPSETPTEIVTPTHTATPTPDPCAEPGGVPPYAGDFAEGRVKESVGLQAGPGAGCDQVVEFLGQSAPVTWLSGPYAANGVEWIRVRSDETGAEGWIPFELFYTTIVE
jgi:hypothetical protein